MTSNSKRGKECPLSTVSPRFADLGMQMFCLGNVRNRVLICVILPILHAVFSLFAYSGRSTCAPNALGREIGLHPDVTHDASRFTSNLFSKPVIEIEN